jgi:flavin reductase (DIM6/NTAB) family NADH-FMN oxidoreductase RutF
VGLGSFVETADVAMVVVTAEHRGERAGCLVGFHTQCSIQPERYAVFVSKENHTFGVARRAGRLAVHLLADDQFELAELFGAETDDELAQKFARVAWSEEPGGCPVLDEARRWFVGDVVERFDAGDHVAFVLAPDRWSDADPPIRPLRFGMVRDMTAGHEVD